MRIKYTFSEPLNNFQLCYSKGDKPTEDQLKDDFIRDILKLYLTNRNFGIQAYLEYHECFNIEDLNWIRKQLPWYNKIPRHNDRISQRLHNDLSLAIQQITEEINAFIDKLTKETKLVTNKTEGLSARQLALILYFMNIPCKMDANSSDDFKNISVPEPYKSTPQIYKKYREIVNGVRIRLSNEKKDVETIIPFLNDAAKAKAKKYLSL